MAKMITPVELAELVAGLCVSPSLLCSQAAEQHLAFLSAIAEVVADHYGGHVSGCTDAIGNEGDDALPMVAVRHDHTVPVGGGVWAAYDTEGWDGEEPTALTPAQAESHRRTVRSAFVKAYGQRFSVNLSMQDWRVCQSPEELQPGDDRTYQASLDLSLQDGNLSLDIVENEPGERPFGLSLIAEINHGVPALHLGQANDDLMLHVHSTDQGLVLTPDQETDRWCSPTADRYSYARRKDCGQDMPTRNALLLPA